LLFLAERPICGVVATLVLINIINMIPEDDILCLLLIQAIKDDKERKNLFRELLTIAERRLRSGKIRRGALLPPSQSAFMYLYNSGQDDALVTLCGFNHASFSALLALFEPIFNENTPYSSSAGGGLIKALKRRDKKLGRPRRVTAVIVLGLVLFRHQYTSDLFASRLLIDSRLLEDEMLLLNAGLLLLVLSCGDLQLNEEMSSLFLEKTQEKALE
jgi:hypothetical protein